MRRLFPKVLAALWLGGLLGFFSYAIWKSGLMGPTVLAVGSVVGVACSALCVVTGAAVAALKGAWDG